MKAQDYADAKGGKDGAFFGNIRITEHRKKRTKEQTPKAGKRVGLGTAGKGKSGCTRKKGCTKKQV